MTLPQRLFASLGTFLNLSVGSSADPTGSIIGATPGFAWAAMMALSTTSTLLAFLRHEESTNLRLCTLAADILNRAEAERPKLY